MFRLQGEDDPECLYFQEIAEQGHYRGGPRGRTTRQGIYAFAASGRLLASINSLDPQRVAAMLESARKQWELLPTTQRGLTSATTSNATTSNATAVEGVDWRERMIGRQRWEWHCPKDGLVLETTSRDLPRVDGATPNQRPGAWNRDYAWFTNGEAESFLPAALELGAQQKLPQALAERLVRFHLVDNVRGQTQAFDPSDIVTATIETTVVRKTSTKVHLRLTGRTHAVGSREWRNHERPDEARPARERGMVCDILGYAVYDLDQRAFANFDAIAVGTRWGAALFNGRRDDTDPAPIGIALRLSKRHFVAPAFFQLYGWKGSQRPGAIPLEPDGDATQR